MAEKVVRKLYREAQSSRELWALGLRSISASAHGPHGIV